MGFLTCENFEPCDFFLIAVSFLHSSVEYSFAGFPDVTTDSITFDEGDNRMIRSYRLAVLEGYLLALRYFQAVVSLIYYLTHYLFTLR